jgi:hypothetical protein
MLKAHSVEREGDTAFLLNNEGTVMAWMDWDTYVALAKEVREVAPVLEHAVFPVGDKIIMVPLDPAWMLREPLAVAGPGGTRRA